MPTAVHSNRRSGIVRILTGGAALVLLGAAAYLAVGAYVAFKLTEPQRQTLSNSPAFAALSLESPRIRSRDGLTLASWYLPASGSDRAVVVVHGLNQCRSCEFHGRFVEFGGQLRGQGYNVLMIDLRGHGESEGAHLNELPHVASPVLLIYGVQDRYITPAQMQTMAAARPNSETWWVDDAGHAGSYEAHPAEYVARVSHFFDQSLH